MCWRGKRYHSRFAASLSPLVADLPLGECMPARSLLLMASLTSTPRVLPWRNTGRHQQLAHFALWLALAVCMVPTPGYGACADVYLPRAGFADRIVEREPLGDGSAADERLWFFSEVHQGAGLTLRHHWLRDGEADVMVELPIGADRWRTWSSRRSDEAQWSVRISTDSGCDLGTYAMLNERDTLLLLAQARQMLAENDLAGARSVVRHAQQAGNHSVRLQRFLEQQLALAELAQDIERDDLYTASGRIDALAVMSLSTDEKAQLTELQQRWQQRRSQLHAQLEQRLVAVQLLLSKQPVSCETDIRRLLPADDIAHVLISEQQHQAGEKKVSLLDRRTGLTLPLGYSCIELDQQRER